MRLRAKSWRPIMKKLLPWLRTACGGAAASEATVSSDVMVDAEMECFIGPIPAMPEGREGHELLAKTFLELIDVVHPGVLCDIGANDGSTARAAKQRRPELEVHGFEANPRIHAANAATCTRLGVRWHNVAVTDHYGVVPIYMPRTLSRSYVNGEIVAATAKEPPDTGKSSLLLRDEDATYERFDAQAVTLDQFLDGQIPIDDPRRVFLWIDVEGAADRVLAGAREVLKCTAVIFIEIEGFGFWREQSDGGRVIEALRRAGFVPLARDREYGDKQFNVLLIHETVMPLVRTAMAEGRLSVGSCLAPTKRPPMTLRPGTSRDDSKRQWRSIASWLSSEVPVLVPCFNNPTYTAQMHGQLQRLGMKRIVYIDNGSTSPEMISLLDTLADAAVVVRVAENLGPRFAFLDPATYALLPRLFCLTDPDIEFHQSLPSNFLGELANLITKYEVGKAGFALNISDRHRMHDRDFRIGDGLHTIWNWERKFWESPVGFTSGGDRVYRAAIDTTFALYDKRYFKPDSYLSGLRVAGRFTARHLPWYVDETIPDDESLLYRQTQQHSFYFREAG